MRRWIGNLVVLIATLLALELALRQVLGGMEQAMQGDMGESAPRAWLRVASHAIPVGPMLAAPADARLKTWGLAWVAHAAPAGGWIPRPGPPRWRCRRDQSFMAVPGDGESNRPGGILDP